MKFRMYSFVYGLAMTVILVQSACSSVSINRLEAHIRGNISTTNTVDLPGDYDENDVRNIQLQPLVDQNEKALKWYREKELPLYRKTSSNNLPQTCLALSGGGIRAAAYSIGVMKGLQSKGILENIDIISSVSGGSYALSWIYIQNSNGNAVNPDFPNRLETIFTKEPRFINELAENGNMYTANDFIQSGIADTLFIPLNFVANGIFRWNWNTTPARANYEYEIRKLFQSGLVKSLEEAEGWVKKYKLPYFIINTTARIDDDKFHHGAYLSNTVFEFTPLRFGSDAFGYGYKGETNFPITFSEAISISGAAADSSVVAGDMQKVILSAMNHDLGFYVKNYTLESKRKNKWWTKLIPFPFYFLSSTTLRDKDSTDIYLSDGGHSENLAAFSLIRRACEKIIIVDAEYDPQYQFEAYFKLKDAIKKEMGVELSVPNIDKIREELTCRGSKNPVDVCNGLTEKPSGQEFDTRFPVVEGEIVEFPIYSSDKGKIVNIRPKIIYVKLAIDDQRLKVISDNEALASDRVQANQDFGKNAVDYYIKSRHGDCGNYILRCAFPQYSTIDQSYTPEQFMAYIDLGEHNVTQSKVFKELSGRK